MKGFIVKHAVDEGFDCGECGQRVGGGVVFHPYLYCLLYKNGVHDQEQYLRSSGFVRAKS